jgi:hypothetical protein
LFAAATVFTVLILTFLLFFPRLHLAHGADARVAFDVHVPDVSHAFRSVDVSFMIPPRPLVCRRGTGAAGAPWHGIESELVSGAVAETYTHKRSHVTQAAKFVRAETSPAQAMRRNAAA